MNHPLTRIASKIPALYRENQRAWLFIFCVVLSALFWTFNALNKTYTYTIYAPLGKGGGDDTLAITLEGKGFDLFAVLSLDSMPVHPPAPTRFFGTSINDTLPQQVPSEQFVDMELLKKHEVNVTVIKPAFIQPEQQIIAGRKVPIQLNLAPSKKKQYELEYGKLILKPDSVQLFGPYQTIRKINSIATSPLTLPVQPGVMFQGLNLVNPNPEQIRLSSEYVWAYCNIEELTEGSFMIQVSKPSAHGATRKVTVPEQVKITFQVKASELKTISPADFIVSLKLSQRKHNRVPVILEKYPANVRNLRIIPEYVEYYLVEQL